MLVVFCVNGACVVVSLCICSFVDSDDRAASFGIGLLGILRFQRKKDLPVSKQLLVKF